MEHIKTIRELYNDALKIYKEIEVNIKNGMPTEKIFVLSNTCSNNLYTAVEQCLKLFATINILDYDFSEFDNLAALCKKAQNFIPEKIEIDLNVFVFEKEVRNLLTHNAKLARLNGLARVFLNLRRLIWIIDDEIALEEVHYFDEESIDFQEIYSELSIDNKEDITHILITDSLNDIDIEKKILLSNIYWDTVYDFSIESDMDLKSYRNISALNTINLSINDLSHLPDTALNSGKKTWISLNSSNSPIPKQKKHWTVPEKENLQLFVKKSFDTNPKKAVIICLKRFNPVVTMLLEHYYNYYNELQVMFLNETDQEVEKQIEDILDRPQFKIYLNSIPIVLNSFLSYKRMFCNSNLIEKKNTLYKIPSRDGACDLDISMQQNLEDFFEIVHLNIVNMNANPIEDYDDFLSGNKITWSVLERNKYILPVEKSNYSKFLNELQIRLKTKAKTPSEKLFSLTHRPGFGGSSLLKKIAWDIHHNYPVLILKKFSRTEVYDQITNLYDKYKKGILILVDENDLDKNDLDDFERLVMSIDRPIACCISCRSNGLKNIAKNNNTLNLRLLTDIAVKDISEDYMNYSIKKGNNYNFVSKDDNMKKLLKGEMLCPFIIGLYYLEENFHGLDGFVKKTLERINENHIKDLLLKIAFVDYFGRMGLPKFVISKLSKTKLQHTTLKKEFIDLEELIVETRLDSINGNDTIWRLKHYLIAKELLINLLKDNSRKTTTYKDYLSKYGFVFFKSLIGCCRNTIPIYINRLITNIYISNQIKEYNSENNEVDFGFSLLIQEIPIKEEKESLMKNISTEADRFISELKPENSIQEYQLLAHIWAHNARLYYKILNNYDESSKKCAKAIEIMQKINREDPIIYHIYGDSIAKRIKYRLSCFTKDYMANEDDIESLYTEVQSAKYYFRLSRELGNSDFSIISNLKLNIDFIEFIFRNYKINSINETLKLNFDWLSTLIDDTYDSISEINEEELRDNSLEIFKNLENKFHITLFTNNYGKIINKLDNELQKLQSNTIKNSNQIYATKKFIVLTLLRKHDSSYTKLSQNKKDSTRIMEILDENFENGIYGTFDCNLWFKLAKHLGKDLDSGIIVARKWKKLVEEQNRKDPRPYYYLYTTKILRATEGFQISIDDCQKQIIECKNICKSKENTRIINISKPRDWFASGNGLAQSIDDTEINHEEFSNYENISVLQGKLSKFSDRNTSAVITVKKPLELNGLEVHFNPSDSGYNHNQNGRLVSFKLGFSYERPLAFNKSVKIIDSNYAHKTKNTQKKQKQKFDNSDFARAYIKAEKKKEK